MFGSEVLDVGIGLVLIFLLASIVMTAAQEGIEAIFQTRAAFLQQAIRELMQDQDGLDALYRHPLVFALYRGAAPGAPEGWLARMKTAVVGGMSNLPAYIPREVFSAALIDLKSNGQTLPAELEKAYAGLDRLTGGDAARLRREIEGWYDGAMDRASGWFKKRSQRSLFFLGLVAAVALNINAVTIAQFLNANDAQRLLVVGTATSIARPTAIGSETSALADVDPNVLQSRLAHIGLPIGWSAASQRWISPETTGDKPWLRLPLIIAGWLITALAMMLGAPFWFDVLNRLMVIRSTVKPKEKSPDEPSEDGGKAAKSPGGEPLGRTGNRTVGASTTGATGGEAAGPERDRAMSDAQPIYG